MTDEAPRPLPRPGIEERGPLERYHVWRSQRSYDDNEVPHSISLGDMRALAFAQAQAENRGVNTSDVADLAFPTALVEGRPVADEKGRGYAQPAYGANEIELPQFHIKKYGNPSYDANWRFPAQIPSGVYHGSDPNITPAGKMGLRVSPVINIGLGEKDLMGRILPLRAGDTTVVDKHGNRFLDNYKPNDKFVPEKYYDKQYPYNAPHRAEVATPYDAALHQAQLLQAHLAAAKSRSGGRSIAEAWNGKGKTGEADAANHGRKVAEMQQMLEHPANRGTLEAYRFMLNNFRNTMKE
jgi:hypothetical protein